MRVDRDLTAASVVPLLLLVLAEQESYGYQIIQRIRVMSEQQWQMVQQTLFNLGLGRKKE